MLSTACKSALPPLLFFFLIDGKKKCPSGKEWIAPNWMLQNPQFANIIGTLEVARKEKRMYASGGFNNENASATSSNSPAAVYNFERLENLMVEMIMAQQQANDKKVVNVWSETQEFLDNMAADRVRQSA